MTDPVVSLVAKLLGEQFMMGGDYAHKEAIAFLTALHAAGKKVLDREPTGQMSEAANAKWGAGVNHIWRIMWDAAPTCCQTNSLCDP